MSTIYGGWGAFFKWNAPSRMALRLIYTHETQRKPDVT
jgi:hypothetical protein